MTNIMTFLTDELQTSRIQFISIVKIILLLIFVCNISFFFLPFSVGEFGPEDVYDNNGGNDTYATAASLNNYAKIYEDLCQADDDWYKIYVEANHTLNVSIIFDHSDNDMRLDFCYNETLNFTSDSHSEGYETYEFFSPITHTFRIRISGVDNYALYTLIVNLFTPFLGDDVYEENDNALFASTLTNGTYYMESYDEDWYQIYCGVPQKLRFFLNYDLITVNLYMALYYREDDNFYQLELNSSISNFKTLEKIVYSPRWYYLRIYHGSVFDNVSYTLTIDTILDDAYEDNDSEIEAAVLNPGEYSGLIQADEDFYIVNVPINFRLTVSYNLESLTGNFWMHLIGEYTSNSTALTTKTGTLTLVSEQGDPIIIRIYGNDHYFYYNISVSYELWDDRFEPNDVYDDAPELYTGNLYSHLIQKDDDWFKFWLSEGRVIKINLTSSDSLSHLHMSFYTETLFHQADSAIQGTCLFLESYISQSMYYYLRINGTNSQQEYHLNISIYIDDVYENNDNLADAFEITDLDFSDYNMYLWDEDWYQFSMSYGDFIYGSVYFNEEIAFEISFYQEINKTLQLSNVSRDLYDNGVYFTYGPTIMDQKIFLCVNTTQYQGTGYSLYYNKETRLDDYQEDNDNINEAYECGMDVSFNDLIVSANDPDWFYFNSWASPINGRIYKINISYPISVFDFHVSILNENSKVVGNLTQSPGYYYGTYESYANERIYVHIYTNTSIFVRYTFEIYSDDMEAYEYQYPFGAIPGYSGVFLGLLGTTGIILVASQQYFNRKRRLQ